MNKAVKTIVSILLLFVIAGLAYAIVRSIQQPVNFNKAVKAREITLTRRLMPLFKAAAVVAIILTIGGALQAPWDNSWNTPQDYARIQQDLDSVAAVSPIQAENMSDWAADSTSILMERPKN